MSTPQLVEEKRVIMYYYLVELLKNIRTMPKKYIYTLEQETQIFHKRVESEALFKSSLRSLSLSFFLHHTQLLLINHPLQGLQCQKTV